MKIHGMKDKAYTCGCRCDTEERLHTCPKHAGVLTLVEKASAYTPIHNIEHKQLSFAECFHKKSSNRSDIVYITKKGERYVY